MSEIVAAAVEATSSLLQLKNHELRLDVPWASFDVDADPMRLSQVFVNLLLNAAHYTAPGGVISVKGFRDGRELVIQVEDTGTGLAAEDAARVWDDGGRLGLGLPFVKQVTDLHGGRVSARSPGLGLGTTFEVRLPRAIPVAAQPHA